MSADLVHAPPHLKKRMMRALEKKVCLTQCYLVRSLPHGVKRRSVALARRLEAADKHGEVSAASLYYPAFEMG